MTTTNSTDSSPVHKPAKPSKPYSDFPLFPHASGQWAKKIRGKLYFFGKWDDPDAALNRYLKDKDALHAGRKPKPDTDALTVKELCNEFLNFKRELRDGGELAALTFYDYETACKEIIGAFGKSRLVADLGPDDFAELRNKMARKWGHQRLSKTIQFIRSVFKYGYDSELLDRPIRFGPGFKRPSKKTIRIDRARQGAKLFTAEETRRMIDSARPSVKAMVLLGVNAGFGNADCGQLPLSAVDLDKGWIDFARVKTGIPRRCKLWPETVQAIKEWLEVRPDAKKDEHKGLVFITRCGDSWHTGTHDGPLSRECSKLLRKLGINGRKGLGFYTLRHTFRTVADESKDQPACDFVMGHESTHMSSHYRERISDDRLAAVADVVRDWLFGSAKEQETPDVLPMPKTAAVK